MCVIQYRSISCYINLQWDILSYFPVRKRKTTDKQYMLLEIVSGLLMQSIYLSRTLQFTGASHHCSGANIY